MRRASEVRDGSEEWNGGTMEERIGGIATLVSGGIWNIPTFPFSNLHSALRPGRFFYYRKIWLDLGYATALSMMLTSFSGQSGMAMSGLSLEGIFSGVF